MDKDQRIADLEQQLAEAQAEVERLKEIERELRQRRSYWIKYGMEMAAEIADVQANRDMIDPWISCAKRIARNIRAEIDK